MTSIEFEILGCVKRELNLTYTTSSLHEGLRVLLRYSENRHKERYAHKAHIIHMIFKLFIPPPAINTSTPSTLFFLERSLKNGIPKGRI